MWSLKKKMFPKNAKVLPSCKKDCNGQIITQSDQLKVLYLETYKHRLRHRPIKNSFAQLMQWKEKLWNLRLKLVKLCPGQKQI